MTGRCVVVTAFAEVMKEGYSRGRILKRRGLSPTLRTDDPDKQRLGGSSAERA